LDNTDALQHGESPTMNVLLVLHCLKMTSLMANQWMNDECGKWMHIRCHVIQNDYHLL